MNKRMLLGCFAPLLAIGVTCAHAGPANAVRSVAPGVLCDRFMCANEKGISRSLTAKYLGARTATRLFAHGDFNLTAFTFSNGVFCDANERVCRTNRYFGADGKRSGAVSKKYTTLLFGN